MQKITTILVMLAILYCSTANADIVYLTNGKIVEGNIIDVDREKGKLTLDLVLDGSLTGMALTFDKSEIQNITQDGKFTKLKRKAASQPAAPQINNQKSNSSSATEKTSDINERIRQRAKAEAAQNQKNANKAAAMTKTVTSKSSYSTSAPPMSTKKSTGYRTGMTP